MGLRFMICRSAEGWVGPDRPGVVPARDGPGVVMGGQVRVTEGLLGVPRGDGWGCTWQLPCHPMGDYREALECVGQAVPV